MGCRMSLKLHFLRSHMDFFQDNLETSVNTVKDYSWIEPMERRY